MEISCLHSKAADAPCRANRATIATRLPLLRAPAYRQSRAIDDQDARSLSLDEICESALVKTHAAAKARS
eukprot:6214090-Pleurochrysis_carterae.AAC.1